MLNDEKNGRRIILFSRDPGGANVVAPLFFPLINKGYHVLLFGKDFALKRYKIFGLEGTDIADYIKGVKYEDIEGFLKEVSPDILITGTSADDFTEKFIWKAAKKLGIKSYAILDQWINFGLRFSKYSVSELSLYEENKTHEYLPDKIFVMDEYSKKILCKEGFSEKTIEVTGQPYFDYIIKNKLALKKPVASMEGVIRIIYASEPISVTYKESDNFPHYWGYSERTNFRHVLNGLMEIICEYRLKIDLIIRLHPKENRDNYDDIINENKVEGLNISLDTDSEFMSLVSDCDLVVGMSSMFLIECAVMGIPILSVQIGLSRENPFILDKIGIIKSILKEERLKDALHEIIIDKKNESFLFKVKSGAIENIIKRVGEL